MRGAGSPARASPAPPRLKGPGGEEACCPRVWRTPGPGAPPRPPCSPQSPALVPEGVEPVVAGLGALRGDGQQVGGAAAGLDAACEASPQGVPGSAGQQAGGFPGALPSRQGREGTLPPGPQEEQKPGGRGQTSGSGPSRDPADQAARDRGGAGVAGSTHCSPGSNGGRGQR